MEFTQVASGYAHDNGISVRRVIDDIKSGAPMVMKMRDAGL